MQPSQGPKTSQRMREFMASLFNTTLLGTIAMGGGLEPQGSHPGQATPSLPAGSHRPISRPVDDQLFTETHTQLQGWPRWPRARRATWRPRRRRWEVGSALQARRAAFVNDVWSIADSWVLLLPLGVCKCAKAEARVSPDEHGPRHASSPRCQATHNTRFNKLDPSWPYCRR